MWRSQSLGDTTRKGLWSLVDQTIVSGTRFLTTVLVGRICGASELGYYAIGFSIVILILVVQESLLLTPYTVLGFNDRPRKRRQFAGSVLLQHCLLDLMVMLVLGIAGVFLWNRGYSQIAVIVATLAWTIPFILLREFARKMAFAHFRMFDVLVLDSAVAVLQLVGILAFARAGALSVAIVFGVTGLACATPSLIWLVASRRAFDVRPKQWRSQFSRSFSFGKWVLGSQQIRAVGNSMIYWLLPVLVSTTATGIYAACSTFVTAANPFLLGLANVMEPKAARSFAEVGHRELQRVVRKVTHILALFFAVYWLVVVLVGESLVAWLYRDEIYAGHGHTIIVLTSATAIGAMRGPWGQGLKAMGLPKWNFFSSDMDT